MKKSLFSSIFLFVFCLIGFISCIPEVQPPEIKKTETTTELFKGTGQTDGSENSSITGFVGDNWADGIEFLGDQFNKLEEGDVLEISVRGIETDSSFENNYTRLYFRNLTEGNVYFEKLEVNPNIYSICKEENGSMLSRLQLEANTEYLVTIPLSQSDIDGLIQNGLKLKGPNCIVKSVIVKHTEYNYKTLKEQYAAYESQRNSIIKKYSKIYKTPIVYITTFNREDVVKKEYYESIIDVVNCDAQYKLSKKGEVKVRGNSTANPEYGSQMPYRIKFNKKQNMLGLHNGREYKSWVLLKSGGFNASDYLGFKLAHEIYKTSDYKYYASDCMFVHVFVNDVYKGEYLLCEQNQVNEDRVDVNENIEKSTSNNIGYMLELDNYAWDDLKDGQGRWFGNGCSQGKDEYHVDVQYLSENPDENVEMEVWGNLQTGVNLTDINGETRGCIPDTFSLKNDIYSDSQVQFIQKYLTNLWNMCYLAIEKGQFYKFDADYDLVEAPEYTSAKEVCDAAIDLESLCNEMILEELVRDNDVGAGSLYMAIDFSKAPGEKYSKFTFECPWDFNWAYQPVTSDKDGGAYWNGKTQYFAGGWQTIELLDDHYDRSHPWFILFNNAPWFRQMLKEKWDRIGKENLKAVANSTDTAVSNAGRGIGGTSSVWITDFVRNRIDYIDKNLWK